MTRITRHTTLFFDASVLVAGVHSVSGGSGLLLAACQAGGFRAQVTSAVLLEALHALKGSPQQHLSRFRQLLIGIKWELLPVPPAQTLEHYHQYISAKDVHVLAAAVEGKAEFLLTLDRQHILAVAEVVKEAGLPITILRPGDFIRHYYPQHEDYPVLPPARG